MEVKTLMEEMEKDKTVLDTVDNQQLVWSLQTNLNQIIEENSNLAKRLELEQIIPFIYQIQQANHIFITAAGRSGFAMRAAAMRLMHLGFSVYYVGDTTTPAIKKGDLLIAASGSGTTETIVRSAEKSIQAGAKLVAITTNATSKLAELATHPVIVPAAEKQDHSKKISSQYAGSLFEQFILLLNDAIFQSLWKLSNKPAEVLWKNHSNLE
ncbi:6-phospho-3-hexuloisomerase [Pedobacter sp. MC2016-05]|uniref:6-phospho-3-hexuloisomerase n=1 Tax=Pedobacter sp. MC2016-05 TaxID=2994474 RepID=UPI002247C28A|nr:6-phospho-3-hexuloisomerase [Pedobacter sp. MC2016-05]MCX2473897.1 6-phospho-3-hexuloisomerase [Pedobacter sp. MC2016-05]